MTISKNYINKTIQILYKLTSVTNFKVLSSLIIVLTLSYWNVEAHENRTTISKSASDNIGHRANVLKANGEPLQTTESREAIHPDDSLALVALYETMQGDHWIDNEGWLDLPVDFWSGVDQVENVGTDEDPEWRITQFIMPRYNMTVPGYIPAEIGKMTHLRRFSVIHNLMVGEIPDEIKDMEHLEEWLNNANYQTGEIPWNSFMDLDRFRRFEQENNLFYGTAIPENIGDWKGLQRFNIRRNEMLEGTIPSSLGNGENLENLEYLYIEDTRLTGDLPDLSGLEELTRIRVSNLELDPGPLWGWMADMSDQLQNLRLANSNRTGPLPAWLADMSALRELRIGEHWKDPVEDPIGSDGNDIPLLLALSNLQYLEFRGPGFTGNIPDWLGDMISIQRLIIVDTNFEGPIPGSLGNSRTLRRITIEDNLKLTGGIPDEFQDLTGLTRLVISNTRSAKPDDPLDHSLEEQNLSVGQLPDWLGNLTGMERLQLRNIGITGDLPDLSELTNLEDFRFSDNPELTGDLDESFFESLTLEDFSISRTSLNIDEVPEWLNSQRSRENLSTLALGGLGLEGEIPAWLGDMTWLSSLSLEDNNLTGSIPSQLGNLNQITTLNLANNNLSGEIPDNLTDIGRLGGDVMVIETMNLYGNEDLTGFIPFNITDASFMRHFHIDGTQVCLPEDVDTWLDGFSEYAENQNPSDYYSMSTNNEFCDDPTSTDHKETAYMFRLQQNYPNPFNPTTTIKYEIPENDMRVSLEVYNVIGQKVVTLVDEYQSAGKHEVNFDATRLTSGVYIYKLSAGELTASNQMILVK